MPRMRMMLMLAALAGLLLAVPTTAGAAKRFRGCVAESSGCKHKFFGGDLPVIRFEDLRKAGTAYRVCVRRVGYAKHCVSRSTGKAGRWHTAGTWNIGGTGPHIARWYVNGTQVARWKFRVVSEGD
jgi:hypothetical protein